MVIPPPPPPVYNPNVSSIQLPRAMHIPVGSEDNPFISSFYASLPDSCRAGDLVFTEPVNRSGKILLPAIYQVSQEDKETGKIEIEFRAVYDKEEEIVEGTILGTLQRIVEEEVQHLLRLITSTYQVSVIILGPECCGMS